MNALQFAKTGDLAALHYLDVPKPTPAQGEVLIQVKAAGLNPSDVKNVLGRFPYTTLPRIPGRGLGKNRGAHVLGAVRRPEHVKALNDQASTPSSSTHPKTSPTSSSTPRASGSLAPFGRIAIIAASGIVTVSVKNIMLLLGITK